MKINDTEQTAEQLLAMLIPDTKPDPLTAARNRARQIEWALGAPGLTPDEMAHLRGGLIEACREINALETAALKEIRK